MRLHKASLVKLEGIVNINPAARRFLLREWDSARALPPCLAPAGDGALDEAPAQFGEGEGAGEHEGEVRRGAGGGAAEGVERENGQEVRKEEGVGEVAQAQIPGAGGEAFEERNEGEAGEEAGEHFAQEGGVEVAGGAGQEIGERGHGEREGGRAGGAVRGSQARWAVCGGARWRRRGARSRAPVRKRKSTPGRSR